MLFQCILGALFVLIFVGLVEGSAQTSGEAAGHRPSDFNERELSYADHIHAEDSISKHGSVPDKTNDSFSHPEGRVPVRKEALSDKSSRRKANAADDEDLGTEMGVRKQQLKNEENVHELTESSDSNRDSDQEKHRQKLISKIIKLLRRHRDLASARESLQDSNMKESDTYNDLLRKRNALSQAWEKIHRARLRVENDLDFFKTHSELQDETLMQLGSQTKDGAFLLDKLKKKYAHLLKHKAQLAEDFREHGLEHWVENSVKGTVNPIVLDAIMQGTGYFVEPMLDGIEKLASVNDEVASAVSQRLRNQTSLANYPFYAGFVSYTVLLCPLVIIVSALARVKKGISRLSRNHWIVVGTFYFVMVTGGCLLATIFGSVDVLQTFRLHNVHIFNLVLVVHGLAFFVYMLLHLYNLIRAPRQEAVSHFVVVATIGIHFFIRSQRQSLRAESLEVDAWTYFVYNAVLSFVLYETALKRDAAKSKICTVHASGD